MKYKKLLLPVAMAGVTVIASSGVAVGASRGPSLAGAPFLTPVPAAVNTRDAGTELLDGGFEASAEDPGGWIVNNHWAGGSTNWNTPFCNLNVCFADDARSGDFWVWFASGDAAESADVVQPAVIPDGDTVTLSFYLAAPDCEAATYSFSVWVGVDEVWGFDEASPPAGCGSLAYTQVEVDISDYAGNEENISFSADIAVGAPTNIYVDDVAITATQYSYFRPGQAVNLPPPDADCDTVTPNTEHYGRMIADKSSGDLWVCTSNGWQTVAAAPPI